jgi:hypothetical protein
MIPPNYERVQQCPFCRNIPIIPLPRIIYSIKNLKKLKIIKTFFKKKKEKEGEVAPWPVWGWLNQPQRAKWGWLKPPPPRATPKALGGGFNHPRSGLGVASNSHWQLPLGVAGHPLFFFDF